MNLTFLARLYIYLLTIGPLIFSLKALLKSSLIFFYKIFSVNILNLKLLIMGRSLAFLFNKELNYYLLILTFFFYNFIIKELFYFIFYKPIYMLLDYKRYIIVLGAIIRISLLWRRLKYYNINYWLNLLGIKQI